MRHTSLFTLVLLVSIGRPSTAQTITRPSAESSRDFGPGDTVLAAGRAGGETRGRFVRVSPSIVVAVRGEEREIPSTPPGPPAAPAQAIVDARARDNVLGTLSSRVEPGDTVSVRVTSGENIVGTFSRASESSLTVEVDGRSREIPADTVLQVVRRRGANRLRRGLLIGAPVGALLGSSACYRVDTSRYKPGSGPPPSCGASVLGGAVIGGGIGALIGWRTWRPTLVYSTPPGSPLGQRQAAAAAPPSRIDGRAGSTLAALSSRVLSFETIYVGKTNGEEIQGRFVRASEASLTVEVEGQTREILASDVRTVWRRGGNRVKRGMLIGFLAGAAVADIAALTSGSESDWSSGETIFLGTVAGGGAGLMWGALIGAFFHDRPVVYPATAATVRLMPVLGPGRAGVMLTARF